MVRYPINMIQTQAQISGSIGIPIMDIASVHSIIGMQNPTPSTMVSHILRKAQSLR